MPGSGILAVGAAELWIVLILLCVVVVPIAAVAFARSGKGYSEIGKGRFSVDFGDEGPADRDEEVRQLVEAKAYRQARRGEDPLDVDSEIDRLLGGEGVDPAPETQSDPEMAAIRDEIRQIVIANNERRVRRGEDPLDVEAEVDRRLAEFG
jgi:hypothetical protein